MNRFGLAPTALLLASTLTTFGLAACSDDAGGSPTPTPTTTATTSPPAVPTKTCDSAGLVRCDERGRAETCTADAAGNLAWGPKARCANANQVCKGSACVDAPAEAVAQLADMSRVTDFLLDYHPWREPVDEAKATAAARRSFKSPKAPFVRSPVVTPESTRFILRTTPQPAAAAKTTKLQSPASLGTASVPPSAGKTSLSRCEKQRRT